jgi:predicted Co/Zn/Cd cation transporter (cation efflux family)
LKKNNSHNISLDDRLLSIERHGWKVAKTMSISILVFYIALKPETASIFLIEYLKIDPISTLTILLFALPLLLSLLIARLSALAFIISFRFFFVGLYYIIVYALPIAIILVVNAIIRKSKSPIFVRLQKALSIYLERWSVKVEKKLSGAEKRAENNSEKGSIYRSHLVLFILIFTALFFAQFHNNFIGKNWNPKYNKKYKIITNLHYYCQITGSYNSDQCKEWKNEYKKYQLH